MSGSGPRASSAPPARGRSSSPSPKTGASPVRLYSLYRPPSDNNKAWKDWFQKKIQQQKQEIEKWGKIRRITKEASTIAKATNYQTFYLFETVETQSDNESSQVSKKLQFGQVYFELSKLTGIQTIEMKDASGTSKKMIIGIPALKVSQNKDTKTMKTYVLLFDGNNLTFPGAWYLWLAREKSKLSKTSAPATSTGGPPKSYTVFLAAQFLESLKRKNSDEDLNNILEKWKLIMTTSPQTVESLKQRAYTKKPGKNTDGSEVIEEKEIDVWSIFGQAGCHVEKKLYKEGSPTEVLYLRSSVNPTYIKINEKPFSDLIHLVKETQKNLISTYGESYEGLKSKSYKEPLEKVITHLPCLPPANYLTGKDYEKLPGKKSGGKVDDPTARVISQIENETKGLLEDVFHELPEGTEEKEALEKRARSEQEKKDLQRAQQSATRTSSIFKGYVPSYA